MYEIFFSKNNISKELKKIEYFTTFSEKETFFKQIEAILR